MNFVLVEPDLLLALFPVLTVSLLEIMFVSIVTVFFCGDKVLTVFLLCVMVFEI